MKLATCQFLKCISHGQILYRIRFVDKSGRSGSYYWRQVQDVWLWLGYRIEFSCNRVDQRQNGLSQWVLHIRLLFRDVNRVPATRVPKKIPKAGNLLPALISEPPRHQPNRCSRVVSATLSYGDSVHDICSFQHHHSCEAVELTQSAVIWRQLPPIINWSTAQNISGPRIQISRELASLLLVC